MSIESTNPQYDERTADWEQVRDCFKGSRWIKSLGVKYLPATSGMIEDGVLRAAEPGKSAYDAYRTRAVFPNAVKDAVDVLVGVMHRKPPVIQLPPELEPMREKAT